MGEERKVYKVLVGNSEERDHLEEKGVGGKMGSERILGILDWGCVDWIRQAQNRDRWRAIVSAVMNL
jgi:hypothetical protein